jgi:hypothetical protein
VDLPLLQDGQVYCQVVENELIKMINESADETMK